MDENDLKLEKYKALAEYKRTLTVTKPENNGTIYNYEEEEQIDEVSRKVYNARYNLYSPHLERLGSGFGVYSEKEEEEDESEEENKPEESVAELTSSEEEFQQYLEETRMNEEKEKREQYDLAHNYISTIKDPDVADLVAEEETRTDISSEEEEEEEETDEDLAKILASDPEESSGAEKEENDFDKDKYLSELEDEDKNSDQFSFTSMPENAAPSRASELSKASFSEVIQRNSEEEEMLILKKMKEEEKKKNRKGKKKKRRRKKKKKVKEEENKINDDNPSEQISSTKKVVFEDDILPRKGEKDYAEVAIVEETQQMNEEPVSTEEEQKSVQRYSVNTFHIEEYESDVYDVIDDEIIGSCNEEFCTIEAASDTSSGSYDVYKFRFKRRSDGKCVLVRVDSMDSLGVECTESVTEVDDLNKAKRTAIPSTMLSEGDHCSINDDIDMILNQVIDECFQIVSRNREDVAKQTELLQVQENGAQGNEFSADSVLEGEGDDQHEELEGEENNFEIKGGRSNEHDAEEDASSNRGEGKERDVAAVEIVRALFEQPSQGKKETKIADQILESRPHDERNKATRTRKARRVENKTKDPLHGQNLNNEDEFDLDFFDKDVSGDVVDVSDSDYSIMDENRSDMTSKSDKVDTVIDQNMYSSSSSIPESFKLEFQIAMRWSLLRQRRTNPNTYQRMRNKSKKLVSNMWRNMVFKRLHPLYRENVSIESDLEGPDPELPSYKGKLHREKQKTEAVAEVIDALWCLVSIEIEIIDTLHHERNRLSFIREIVNDLVDVSYRKASRKEANQNDETKMKSVDKIISLVIDRCFYEIRYRAAARFESELEKLSETLVESVLSVSLNFVLEEERISCACVRNAIGSALLGDGCKMKDVLMVLWRIYQFYEPLKQPDRTLIRKKSFFTWKQRANIYSARQSKMSNLKKSFMLQASTLRQFQSVKEIPKVTGIYQNNETEVVTPKQEFEPELEKDSSIETKEELNTHFLHADPVDTRAFSLGSQSISAHEEEHIVNKEYRAKKLQGSKNAPKHLTKEILQTLPEAKKSEYIRLWLVQNNTIPLPPLLPKPSDRDVLAGRKRRFARRRPETVLSEASDLHILPIDTKWLHMQVRMAKVEAKGRPESPSVYTDRESQHSEHNSNDGHSDSIKRDAASVHGSTVSQSDDEHIFKDDFFHEESDEKIEETNRASALPEFRFDHMKVKTPLPREQSEEKVSNFFEMISKRLQMEEERKRKEEEMMHTRKMSLLGREKTTKDNFYLTHIISKVDSPFVESTEPKSASNDEVEDVLNQEEDKGSDWGAYSDFDDDQGTVSPAGVSGFNTENESDSIKTEESNLDDKKLETTFLDLPLKDDKYEEPIVVDNESSLSQDDVKSEERIDAPKEESESNVQDGDEDEHDRKEIPEVQVRKEPVRKKKTLNDASSQSKSDRLVLKRQRPIIHWKNLQPVLPKDARKHHYAKAYLTINQMLFRDLTIAKPPSYKPVPRKPNQSSTLPPKGQTSNSRTPYSQSEKEFAKKYSLPSRAGKAPQQSDGETRQKKVSSIQETIERLTKRTYGDRVSRRATIDTGALNGRARRGEQRGVERSTRHSDNGELTLPKISSSRGVIASSAEQRQVTKRAVPWN